MKLMKASVVSKRGTEGISVKSIPKPVIQDNEILIKVSYAPVTPTDLVAVKGDPMMERIFTSLVRPKTGVYGEMYVGEIEEVGSEVSNFKAGDRVYGTNGMKLGAYAEYIRVKDTTVIRKVPSNVKDIDTLALLDGGITALPFLREKGLIKKGQKVLVIGASGSVGSMGVQIAKHFKAHVTGTCSTKNLDTIKSLGCDEVIDYTKTNYKDLNETYDIIFDAVGKSSFKECSHILTAEGRYLVTVPTPSIMLKNLFVKNQKGKKALFAATGLRKPNLKHIDLEFLEGLLESGEITPLVDKVFSLSEMAEAQKLVKSGRKTGNVIIKVV